MGSWGSHREGGVQHRICHPHSKFSLDLSDGVLVPSILTIKWRKLAGSGSQAIPGTFSDFKPFVYFTIRGVGAIIFVDSIYKFQAILDFLPYVTISNIVRWRQNGGIWMLSVGTLGECLWCG